MPRSTSVACRETVFKSLRPEIIIFRLYLESYIQVISAHLPYFICQDFSKITSSFSTWKPFIVYVPFQLQFLFIKYSTYNLSKIKKNLAFPFVFIDSGCLLLGHRQLVGKYTIVGKIAYFCLLWITYNFVNCTILISPSPLLVKTQSGRQDC